MISNGGHHAGTAGGGEGLPAPSPQDQDLVLEAWREALAEVLHSRNNDWQQQCGR
jgi:phage-related tail fiber protein